MTADLILQSPPFISQPFPFSFSSSGSLSGFPTPSWLQRVSVCHPQRSPSSHTSKTHRSTSNRHSKFLYQIPSLDYHGIYVFIELCLYTWTIDSFLRLSITCLVLSYSNFFYPKPSLFNGISYLSKAYISFSITRNGISLDSVPPQSGHLQCHYKMI